MSSSRKSVPCPIAPATTIRFSSLPSLFISAGSIATTIRFNSRGAAVVRARPECCEQLLDQLLLISPLANLFSELGGCLSDCGLGWLRVRALLKQAHQLRRAVIEIALDISSTLSPVGRVLCGFILRPRTCLRIMEHRERRSHARGFSTLGANASWRAAGIRNQWSSGRPILNHEANHCGRHTP